jgi:hypothetical protein
MGVLEGYPYDQDRDPCSKNNAGLLLAMSIKHNAPSVKTQYMLDSKNTFSTRLCHSLQRADPHDSQTPETLQNQSDT